MIKVGSLAGGAGDVAFHRTPASVQGVIRASLFALVALLITGPLVVLLITSFSPPGTLPFQGAALSADNYEDMLTRPGTLRLIANTVGYAGCSVVLGVLLAVTIAWLTERTDLPGRTFFRILMFSWMAVPPLVFGYGWILLINPGNGALNVAIQSLFGLAYAPLTPYSVTALIIISGLSLVPTAYVMISGLLRNMDPSLEDAGYVLGAPRWRTTHKITVPLLSPGLLSVAIFLIMGMVQTFDLPLILGTTAQFPVLSTRIFLLASPDAGPPNYGLSSAFGVFLLIMAMVLMWGYFRAIRLSERFRIVSGRGFRPKRAKLGAWRAPAYALVLGYFTIMLLPLLILLWTSFFPYYRVPSLAGVVDIRFDSYARVLSEPTVLRAILNTILLILLSSTLVMICSCLISWFSVRSVGSTSRMLDVMSFVPTAIPPIVMAVAVLLVFMNSPIYGTIWVLVIGHVTIYLAFGTRTMNGALLQIHKELEDAAVVCGASWMTSLRRVVVPLVWPHILNAWLWVVAHSARDLTFPLILMTSSNVVLASALYLTWDYPDQPGAAALSVVMVLALMVLVVPIQVYTARRIDKS